MAAPEAAREVTYRDQRVWQRPSAGGVPYDPAECTGGKGGTRRRLLSWQAWSKHEHEGNRAQRHVARHGMLLIVAGSGRATAGEALSSYALSDLNARIP